MEISAIPAEGTKDEKAMWLPSGDHAGTRGSSTRSVTLCVCPVSIQRTWIWGGAPSPKSPASDR